MDMIIMHFTEGILSAIGGVFLLSVFILLLSQSGLIWKVTMEFMNQLCG